MRVVLDTNVIIAAFIGKGLCSSVFQICLVKCDIVLSEYILREVKKNLLFKFNLPNEMVEEIIRFLRASSKVVNPALVDDYICEDRSDIPVVGTAVSGNDDFLITGDKELLKLGRYGPITIISPRDFWDKVMGNV